MLLYDRNDDKYTLWYCEIIEHSDYCLFCVDENKENSGAVKALNYAKRKKKKILNIFNKNFAES